MAGPADDQWEPGPGGGAALRDGSLPDLRDIRHLWRCHRYKEMTTSEISIYITRHIGQILSLVCRIPAPIGTATTNSYWYFRHPLPNWNSLLFLATCVTDTWETSCQIRNSFSLVCRTPMTASDTLCHMSLTTSATHCHTSLTIFENLSSHPLTHMTIFAHMSYVSRTCILWDTDSPCP